ncbi:MAG TPA: phosphate ABC transporter permease PstA [Candidatus Polarisedimenticolia bacterium]|nr:phosphate ABC transporter permease PstA [Candidatus Polarisedimenticolia bacterium]
MRRRIAEMLAVGLLRGTVLVVILATFLMLGSIAVQGVGVLSWEFLTQPPVEGMTRGGIFPAIFGTLCITLLMIVMALPLGVCAAIYMVEYAGGSLTARVIRASVNNLAGVPSIVFGLFGVGFFILFIGRSLDRLRGTGLLFGQPAMLWAAATLAVLVLPVIIVNTAESLNAVPRSHREASFALGATRWQTVRRVVLPQARSGILTGSILSISRGAGETAPILFTGCAYFLPRLPLTDLRIPFTGLSIPMVNPLDQFMELSYHIFIMATQSTNAAATRPLQYGTTLVLVGLTFLLNLGAIMLRIRYRKSREAAR